MSSEFDKRLSPSERFVLYFEQAKLNYEISNDVKNATQKSVLEWYNMKYQTSLSESSLSKYLNGINEIPIDVYVNMKDLAGIEDVYCGMSASRKDYEISCDLKESLLFVKEEIEFMCGLKELDGLEGNSIKDITKLFIKYCECASRKDYRQEIQVLQELMDNISFNEAKIKCAMDEKCKVSLSETRLFLRSDYASCYIDPSSSVSIHEDDQNDVKMEASKNSYSSNNMYVLQILADRYNKLSYLVDKCIFLHGNISEEVYMDIPVKEEKDILNCLQTYIDI